MILLYQLNIANSNQKQDTYTHHDALSCENLRLAFRLLETSTLSNTKYTRSSIISNLCNRTISSSKPKGLHFPRGNNYNTPSITKYTANKIHNYAYSQLSMLMDFKPFSSTSDMLQVPAATLPVI